MGSSVRILPHYTYADYIQWEGNWELIEGIPYAMSPLPRMKHQEISGNLYAELKSALKESGCTTCKAYLPVDYKVNDDTVLQPDVLVICNPDEDAVNLQKAPALVVEVLSPSTAIKDRNTKFYIYEAEKIGYYLIVDIDAQTIEIYRMGADGKYKLENADPAKPYTFDFEAGCSVPVTLGNIWP